MKKEKKELHEPLLFTAWAASVIALFGSLYFSEIRHYIPCDLCWYQRILMYPLAILLGMAVVRKDYRITVYSKVLSAFGGMVSLYHYLLQKVSFLAEAAPACGRIPCTGQYINWFGFITIPFLALIAFMIIFICSLLIWRRVKEEK